MNVSGITESPSSQWLAQQLSGAKTTAQTSSPSPNTPVDSSMFSREALRLNAIGETQSSTISSLHHVHGGQGSRSFTGQPNSTPSASNASFGSPVSQPAGTKSDSLIQQLRNPLIVKVLAAYGQASTAPVASPLTASVSIAA
jgi:hypothetical protein